MARRHPDRLAVKSTRHAWTYAGLNEIANRLARAIVAILGPRSTPVALLFEHDAPAIAAILGALKAGKFYASLDPSFPRTRHDAVLADLGAPLLLCDRANLSEALALAGNRCRLLVYEAVDDGAPSEDLGLGLTEKTPIGVFYTSGSTGQSKGVLWNQKLSLHRVAADAVDTGMSPLDRQTLLTSLTFPSSSSDINLALLHGAALHLYDIRKFGTAYLADWLRQEDITCLRMPITLFRHWLRSLRPSDVFPSVRMIGLGGDVLLREDVEVARAHFRPSCAIVHRYTITEAGMVTRLVTTVDARLDTAVVPVGYPVQGKEVLILGEDGGALPSGQAGEIAVRSRYLAAGYWRRPDQTRRCFVPDREDPEGVIYLTGDSGRLRADGCLEFLGRKDFRLKIRGYRVELPAVEAVLRELDEVSEAAVAPRLDASGEQGFVAFVVAAPGSARDAGALRRLLSTRLPHYMLPFAFVFLEEMPLTDTGKVDRAALTRLDIDEANGSGRRFVPPRTPTEEALAAIWSVVLQRTQVGVLDDFFELGGHSLLAAQVIAQVNDELQACLSLGSLYDAPTVAALAALVDQGRHPPLSCPAGGAGEDALREAVRLLGLGDTDPPLQPLPGDLPGGDGKPPP